MLIPFGSYSQQKGSVTDIDGNTYQTVVIGDQEWMAENLKTTKYNDGQTIEFANGVQMDWYNSTSGMYTWYDSDVQYKDVYGALYNWLAATSTNICPVNWHVPTDDEWRILRDFVGTSEGTKLKAITGWNADGNGTDDFGFAALPGGYVSGTFSYSNDGNQGLWWTTVEKNIDDAYNAELSANNDWLDIYYHRKDYGLSIRCIKNEGVQEEVPTLTTTTVTNITQTTASSGGAITNDGDADITAKGVVWSTSTSPTLDASDGVTNDGTGIAEFNSDLTGLTAGTTYYVRAYATNSAGTGYGNVVQFTTYSENVVEDFEGNIYRTVTIGNQVWMAENLRATKYADGTNIVTGLNDTEWNTTTNGALAIYPYSEVDGLNSDEDVVNAYGILYNWFAASNEKGICPTGWKVPSVADWDELLTFLIDDGYSNNSYATTDGAGNALKSCRQVDSPLGGDCATNEHPRWDYYADQYGTNAFGFNGLPAGSRMSTGEFLNVGKMGRFWTSDEDNLNQYNAVRRDLGFGNGRLSDGSITKTNGISIRCIKKSEVQVVVPEVTTTTVTNITQTTASSGGAITDNGGADITAKGVVWSTSTNPTLASNNGSTSNGIGTTEFNSDLTGLTAGTTYYVRAYATNSAGTGYGNEVEFTTLEEGSVEEALPLPFEDSFEGDVSGWSVLDGDDDGQSWEVVTDTPRTGGKHMKVPWNKEGNDDWLITPLLHLPAGQSIKFSLWARSYGSSFPESFDIKVITNDGEQTDDIESVTNVPDSYTEYTYDLSSYAGQEVKVAIVCVSVDQFYLYVDDVSCVVDGSAVEVPTVTTMNVTNITQTTASSGGAITNDGGADITAKGVVWSTTINPTLESHVGFTSNGTGTTEFNSDLTGLIANTTYYVRAYATNSAGTGYGNEVEFTTEVEVVVPTLITTIVTNITQTTASSGGAITDAGGADITAKGVVWSTSTSPTLDASDGVTNDGTGTTEFNSDLTGLTAGTTYYVRAYATNSAGTGYGNEVEFTTTATGVNFELLNSKFAYPNPFASSLTLESEKGISQVVVMNVSGQVVLARQANGESKLMLEADGLDTGLYIVKLTEVDGTNFHIRVVKR